MDGEPATDTEILEAAREAFTDHRWDEARVGFGRVRDQLGPDDLVALSESAWWEGDVDESLAVGEQAYDRYLHGEPPQPGPAAMQALDIAFTWFLRGEHALGSGWLGRAQRILSEMEPGVEHQYLRYLQVEEAAARGDYQQAMALAGEIAAAGHHHGDETLHALALVGQGVAMIHAGRVGQGLTTLDEAMLPVVAGRVRPTVAGNIYCQLMSVCHDLADLRRAQQWTDATARWCEGFPSAVMFIGVCRVHRAQLLAVRGRWADAEAEIDQVCRELGSMNTQAVGIALYELGELRRQRGDLAGAEQAFSEAHRHGRDPQPGLALVQAAQGRAAAALRALVAAEESTADPLARGRLWESMVEVAVGLGDMATAGRAARSLDDLAGTYSSSGLLAAAAQARGRWALGDGDGPAAVAALAEALGRWQQMGARYRVARVRQLLARAHELVGNRSAADLEDAAAAAELATLGVRSKPGGAAASGLTPRETEVLVEVARGASNRQVARALVISDKTVARHLANIYLKLGVTSRTAAAAFAYDQGLVPRGPEPG